jgi:hypothetical protein
MREIKLKANQLSDILDETNALKRAVHELFEHGECSVRDLVEMRYLVQHLIRVFNFYPQKDPENTGEPTYKRDFVFSNDPRAFEISDDDKNRKETDEVLH